MRRLAAALVACLFAAPLAAQAGQADPEPIRMVVGDGLVPEGWTVRFDPIVARPGEPEPFEPDLASISFHEAYGRFFIASGPPALYYREADSASGEYTVSATFAQSRSMDAGGGYGLFIGGANLQTPQQDYLTFEIRPIDGSMRITHQTGGEPRHIIVPWTPHAAVGTERPGGGNAMNELAIRVADDGLHFMANGREVTTISREALGETESDGVFGLRINENLDLMVSDLSLD